MINQKIAQAAKEYALSRYEVTGLGHYDQNKIKRVIVEETYEAGAAKYAELLSAGNGAFKQFYINDDKGHYEDFFQYAANSFIDQEELGEDEFHVIDISALHASQLEVEKMRELLAECKTAFEQIDFELADDGFLTCQNVASQMVEKLSSKADNG